MNELIIIIGVAVGLAMDAFAVSIAAGVNLGCVTGIQASRMSISFGFFQFIMTVIGWLLGASIEPFIDSFGHWVAMALLSAIGMKMIWDAVHATEHDEFTATDPTRGLALLTLSVATSIDALVVGVGFGVLHRGIVMSSIIIGLVAAAFSIAGIRLGCRIGDTIGKKMEISGGVILIAIGIKTVLDQILF